jgi:hypothetical protein
MIKSYCQEEKERLGMFFSSVIALLYALLIFSIGRDWESLYISSIPYGVSCFAVYLYWITSKFHNK